MNRRARVASTLLFLGSTFAASAAHAEVVFTADGVAGTSLSGTETLTFDYTRAEIEMFVTDPKTGATSSVAKTTVAGRR